MSVGSVGQSVFVPTQALSALAIPAVTPSGQPVAVHITPHGAIVRGIGYPNPHHADHRAPKSNDGASVGTGFVLGAGTVGFLGTVAWILTSSRAHIPLLGMFKRTPKVKTAPSADGARKEAGNGSNPSAGPHSNDGSAGQPAHRPGRNGRAGTKGSLRRSPSRASVGSEQHIGQDVAANVALDGAAEIDVEHLAQHLHAREEADAGYLGAEGDVHHGAGFAGENIAAQDHVLVDELGNNDLNFDDAEICS